MYTIVKPTVAIQLEEMASTADFMTVADGCVAGHPSQASALRCCGCHAAGRLTHGMLMGFDNPRMEGLWPTEEECPGFK